jgi:hypothetical protein
MGLARVKVLDLFSIWSHISGETAEAGLLTYFVVQSFERGRKGSLVADQPIETQGYEQAARMAERLSQRKAGVVAFARRGDPSTGDFEEPVVIASYGEAGGGSGNGEW